MYNQAFRRCLLMTNNIQFKILFQSATIFPTVRIVPSICRTANYLTTSQLFSNVNKEKTEVKKLLTKQTITQEDLDQLLTIPEYHKLYTLRKREVELMRHVECTPEVIRPEDWLYLLLSNTKLSRRKYLRYRFLVECKKNSVKKKKMLKSEHPCYDSPKGETDFTRYGLHHNALFLRLTQSYIIDFYTKRLMTHLPFAPKIVFDCGFEVHMNLQECMNCAKQLVLAFSINRFHNNPMNLYFCDLEKHGMLMKALRRLIPTIEEPYYPLNLTSEGYKNLLDKKKMVYLSPHASTTLQKFDENKIYIIGAIVDKFQPNTLSLQRAQQDGIPTCKFPLENYLPWGSGSGKNLTINQTLAILLELRQTNDWEKAFQYVPTRKLQPMRVKRLVQKIAHGSKNTIT